MLRRRQSKRQGRAAVPCLGSVAAVAAGGGLSGWRVSGRAHRCVHGPGRCCVGRRARPRQLRRKRAGRKQRNKPGMRDIHRVAYTHESAIRSVVHCALVILHQIPLRQHPGFTAAVIATSVFIHVCSRAASFYGCHWFFGHDA